jgi:hypothetical protein
MNVTLDGNVLRTIYHGVAFCRICILKLHCSIAMVGILDPKGTPRLSTPGLNIVLGVVTTPYIVTQRLVEPTSRRSSIAGVGERLSCTNSS